MSDGTTPDVGPARRGARTPSQRKRTPKPAVAAPAGNQQLRIHRLSEKTRDLAESSMQVVQQAAEMMRRQHLEMAAQLSAAARKKR